MSIKGYRILSLEANTIYEQEQSNGVDIGYKMPEKKKSAYFCLFNNVLDCGFKDTLIYNNFKNKVIESQKKKLRQGHILLSGTNATLFGNGPEMLMALSGEFDINNTKNTAKVLGTGEIACKKFGHGEKLVCARSPHITMGNLYCVTNNLWNTFIRA